MGNDKCIRLIHIFFYSYSMERYTVLTVPSVISIGLYPYKLNKTYNIIYICESNELIEILFV